ncbi:MAG: agglutinin biogenesis protein MshP [Pseudomonadota bacterium]
MKIPVQRMQGFAIVTAIFILVVLAALGAFIVSISTNQQIGTALDIQGVRAYQAAKSGVEWGIYQIEATPAYNFSYGTPAVAVGKANSNVRACPASPTSFVPTAPTLAAFTVTVTCVATVDANNGPTVFQVISTACNQPAGGICPNNAPISPDYVERRIEVTL